MTSFPLFLATLCVGVPLMVVGQAVPEIDGNSLTSRIVRLVKGIDGNQNGVIEPCEVEDDLFSHYDTDRDGCVSLGEWRPPLTKLGFTQDTADVMFSGAKNISGPTTCTGVPTFGSTEDQVSASLMLSALVEAIVGMCEQDMDRYRTNSDCRQIPLTCQFSRIACYNYACADFVFNKAAARVGVFPYLAAATPRWSKWAPFTDAFTKFVHFHDRDGNGEISSWEFLQVAQSEDLNEDKCLDQTEFLAAFVRAQCGGYGLTEETAVATFRMLRGNGTVGGPSCDGLPFSMFEKLTLKTSDFIDNNLMTLINMCEADRQLYTENRDCSHLLVTCTTSRYSHSRACRYYVDMVTQGLFSFDY
ncbi:uncharacterized protein LOC101861127 [Aplysia californica]|uniref:Uncharacterized protein LOC101861127 n=1 Tax=Aplysia californica TaxID=6500 RepID=A0ABM1A176_APLCA|nr:uncharacterized protein LOC101861127 [Aplysia californica]